MARVTVCIPTFNRSHMLAEAIECVLSQDYTDFELLITDNCSTDETAAAVASFHARDPRVKYHRNKANLGQFGNLSKGILLTNTEYCALLMDDDLWPPDFLSTAIRGLDRKQEAALFSCFAYLSDVKTNFIVGRNTVFGPFDFIDPIGPAVQFIPREDVVPLVALMSLFHPSTFVGRTQSAKRYVPLYEKGNWGGDWLFSAQMGLEGGIVFAPRMFVFARLHPGAEKVQPDKVDARREATYEVQAKIFATIEDLGIQQQGIWQSMANRLNPKIARHVLLGSVCGSHAISGLLPLAIRIFGGNPEGAARKLRNYRRRIKKSKKALGILLGLSKKMGLST